MRCLDACLGFFVFENLLLLPRGFWRSPGGIPSVWLFVCSGFSSLKTFCCCCGFWEVPWWNSLCWVLCARFFVFENILLLPRGFWRSPGGIPSVWLVSAPPGLCVCVCRPGSRTIKTRRGATADQGGRWPTKTPLWSRENVPAVGPFVFVMLGPQKSLSASFVVDAKGSQGFLLSCLRVKPLEISVFVVAFVRVCISIPGP